ncbi:MAG TPA: hypothetical protein VI168_13315 [Croceibacterium sp.]
MLRPILWATLVAGTLDILFAFAIAGAVEPVLRTVASGPLGDAVADGPLGAPLGLLVHFAIMAAMVAAWFVAARFAPVLVRRWIAFGLLYGVALWLAMYWVVMPLRWESYVRPDEPLAIARQLFAHCVLVGLPIAWFAARRFKTRPGFN